MKSNKLLRSGMRLHGVPLSLIVASLLASASPAKASFLHGETLDAVANGIAWVVLIIGPIIGIVVFWLVHILPEKIAEKKKHPQCGAIQCLCLLSLVFGGLLWPIAWLWAYTRPVLYKAAYGTDQEEGHGGHDAAAAEDDKPETAAKAAAEPKAHHKTKGGKA